MKSDKRFVWPLLSIEWHQRARIVIAAFSFQTQNHVLSVC